VVGSAVAIVGIGETDHAALYAARGVRHDRYLLGLRSLRTALDDAGLEVADLDGLITSGLGYERMAGLIGLTRPRVLHSLDRAGRMSGVALQQAVALVQSGAAETIALVYATDVRSAQVTFGGAGDTGYGDAGPTPVFDGLSGMSSPGAYVAMMYRHYAEQYGVPDGALAPLAISNRRHAGLTPGAVMTSPLDEAGYLAARWVAEPLRLLDYCLVNDGAVTLIVTSLERARTLRARPVVVAASAARADIQPHYGSSDLHDEACRDVARRLHQLSGLTPEQMDCLQIYDNFTPITLFALEGFGHAERGTAWQWVRDGRIGFDGPRPLNTSGGHTSQGYLQGWGLLAEATRQIRGEAGARQVAGCDTAQYMCASAIVSSHVLVGE
jgi:acetyl-CoA acetyltransferase